MLRCHAPARHRHRAHRQPHAANAALQGGEDDIDAVLAKFKLDDERHTRVEVKENCPAPSPRVYASFTPIPSQARGARRGANTGSCRLLTAV